MVAWESTETNGNQRWKQTKDLTKARAYELATPTASMLTVFSGSPLIAVTVPKMENATRLPTKAMVTSLPADTSID